MTDNSDQQETAPAAAQPGLRFLELAVYIMGGLLVVMLVVLIGGIAYKAVTRGEAPPPATKEMALGLPAGAEVSAMALDGDRLVLRTAEEIIVLDIRKGTVVARIRLR